MKKVALLVLALAFQTAWPASLPVDAASKYRPCSLLTAAELEAVVRAKVPTPDESDLTVTDGPYKGEIVSTCAWTSSTYVITLSVTRAPRTSQERAAFQAMLRETDEELKKQGWRIEDVAIGGTACATYRPPSGLNALPGAGCALESKGYALSLAVLGSNATPQQVKALADKAAARLR